MRINKWYMVMGKAPSLHLQWEIAIRCRLVQRRYTQRSLESSQADGETCQVLVSVDTSGIVTPAGSSRKWHMLRELS